MGDYTRHTIDEKTISQLGLLETKKQINAPCAPHARVFEYPHLDNVFIMENDLYGTIMPEHSCFIAFKGRKGLVGRSITIEALRNTSVEDIKKLVADNSEG
ncbi:MAG: hypothetical protein ACXVBR_04185 [Flavisolibacter sp.]